MKERTTWLGVGLSLLLVSGCGLVSDIFDPGLASQIGLDPAIIRPQQGTIIVAFNNTTRYPAVFYGAWSLDAQDLTQKSRNFSVEVPAGSVRNEVLECPVGLITPGSFEADFSYNNLAALVTAPGAGEVTYSGGPLLNGSSFLCGYVIEVRLYSIGTGENATYGVTVQVIPG